MPHCAASLVVCLTSVARAVAVGACSLLHKRLDDGSGAHARRSARGAPRRRAASGSSCRASAPRARVSCGIAGARSRRRATPDAMKAHRGGAGPAHSARAARRPRAHAGSRDEIRRCAHAHVPHARVRRPLFAPLPHTVMKRGMLGLDPLPQPEPTPAAPAAPAAKKAKLKVAKPVAAAPNGKPLEPCEGGTAWPSAGVRSARACSGHSRGDREVGAMCAQRRSLWDGGARREAALRALAPHARRTQTTAGCSVATRWCCTA